MYLLSISKVRGHGFDNHRRKLDGRHDQLIKKGVLELVSHLQAVIPQFKVIFG